MASSPSSSSAAAAADKFVVALFKHRATADFQSTTLSRVVY